MFYSISATLVPMIRLSAGAFFALTAYAAVPSGQPNTAIRYQNPAAAIRSFTLAFGPGQWLSLKAVKNDGSTFQLWIQNPVSPRRYIFQQGAEAPREYRHALSGAAVLPSTVEFNGLLPQSQAGAVSYLGQPYESSPPEPAPWSLPNGIRAVALRPDLLIGPYSNARQKDDTRRWDGSDYEMVRFTRDDYRALAASGINCVHVDDEQAVWADSFGQFYWGAGKTLPFPGMLYNPQYLGPALFIDEPAVHTRDFILRPRLAKDPAFRRNITPQIAFKAFQDYFDDALGKRAHSVLDLPQVNLFSWETMPDTAAFQLSRSPNVPEAFVFEPPGRIGARRTLPEFNMTYGTQFAAADTRVLADLIFSFLRGAARLANKSWGVSIYGAVDRADAPLWLTRAYDLGATRFHFWDNYQLAAVPFSEYTALSRHLANHASSHPDRDLAGLKRAAEVAITLPPGYGLGHTHTGRGNLWGLPELNLERTNSAGVTYRTVMSNFFLEAERLLNAGIAFDSLWELPVLPPTGYREIVRIREDGKVEVESAGRRTL
ncbi:MAG: hypothetical protein HZB13_08180, partial [Acidobacteria bacterium]|nr:hypothetical protein [Acidobacteriota bacterium]